MMPFDRELLHRRFAKLTSNRTVFRPRLPQRARLEGRLSLVTKRTEGEDTDDD
ncbi:MULTISPECIES: hypothetical protein [unclassified Sphingomonas]|uniref:hypothetical protein n=1 Tax=unclassified Sphingomonas TaxID=196159 RepID=UPI00226A0631|nr:MULTISPECIES: hypothetical protein [unclassified Sphingomonas]